MMEIDKSNNLDGFFILSDGPSHSFEFGIDCMSYETGPNFKGLSSIPPGIHFIYYSTGMGQRQGFFVHIHKNSLEVRTWDSSNELIESKSTISSENLVNLKYLIHSGQLNNNLGPYPYSIHSSWCNLTSFISDEVLKRSDCFVNTTIYPGDNVDINKSIRRNDSTILDIKPYFNDSARIAKYSSYDSIENSLKENYNRIEDINDRMNKLTKMHIDKSIILTNAIENYFNNHSEELLGELQLSFVLFMFLYSFPALEYWKNTINMICRSESYLNNNIKFTNAFIRLLYEQFNYIPNDFFDEEISKDNFLVPSLSSLFMILFNLNHIAEINESKKRFLQFIQNRFQLFEDDNIPIVNTIDSKLKNINFIGEDKYNLLDDDIPIVVDENHLYYDNQDNNNNIFISTDLSTSKPIDLYEAKYSWRYPNLYEVMKSSQGQEDLIMTAVRVVDEYKDILNQNSNRLKDNTYSALMALVMEAKVFIEEECKSPL